MLQYEKNNYPNLKPDELLHHISDNYQSIVEETVNNSKLQDYDDLFDFLTMFQEYLDELDNFPQDRSRIYVRWILSLFTINKQNSHLFYELLDRFLEFDISYELNDAFEDLIICAYNFSH